MISAFSNIFPKIDKSAFVHKMAILIGDVIIRKRSNIWPGAVLRGDMGRIDIGEETSIQDNCVCHATKNISITTVGNRVVVGHKAVLHGCKIGDKCLIGMGSILLDNSVIGSGSLIAAGSIIKSGMQIPCNSFVVGIPATVKRQTTCKERSMIEEGCRSYLEHLKIYCNL